MTKVLVFESDHTFAGELRTELGRLGCTVNVVDDGNVGLQVAAQDRPDLILLSIELPRMNGFSVCNKLKKDALLKDVPLVIMSSESSEDTFEQHRKLRTRAEDYIHKPIAFGDLLTHIKTFVTIGSSTYDDLAMDDVELVEEGIEEEPDAPPAVAAPVAPPLRTPSLPAPPLPASPAAVAARAAPKRSEKAADPEVDDFIGGAFDRLLGDEEEGRAPGRPAAAAPPSQGAAGPSHTPVKRKSSPPPRSEPAPVDLEAPPAAHFKVSGDAVPREVDSAETERLRGELTRAKDEVLSLSKEVANASAMAKRLEGELAQAHETAGDATRLRREVDDLKNRLTASGNKSGVSSREFLDLREALNKKDKEILSMRDLMSRKDKEALDIRDQLLSIEREKSDQIDKLLELERAKNDLEATVDSLRADKDLANKRSDDFKARGDKFEKQLGERSHDLAAAKEELASAHAAHKERLEAAAAESARALGAAEAARKAALDDAASEHAKELSQREAAWTVRKKDLDGEITNLTMELEQTRERLDSAEERARDLDTKLAKCESELRAAEAKIGAGEARIAELGSDLDHRAAELKQSADSLSAAEETGRELRLDLDKRARELAAAIAEGATLSGRLAEESARLEKARRKWSDDRASLEQAKEGLAAAISKIEEAQARPID